MAKKKKNDVMENSEIEANVEVGTTSEQIAEMKSQAKLQAPPVDSPVKSDRLPGCGDAANEIPQRLKSMKKKELQNYVVQLEAEQAEAKMCLDFFAPPEPSDLAIAGIVPATLDVFYSRRGQEKLTAEEREALIMPTIAMFRKYGGNIEKWLPEILMVKCIADIHLSRKPISKKESEQSDADE